MKSQEWSVDIRTIEGQVGYIAVGHRIGIPVTVGPADAWDYVQGTLDHPAICHAIGYTETLARWNLERKIRERMEREQCRKEDAA